MSIKSQEDLLEVVDNYSPVDDVDSSEIEPAYRNNSFTGLVDDFDNDIYDMDMIRFNTIEDMKKFRVGVVYYDNVFKAYLIKDFDSTIKFSFSELYHIEVIGYNDK